MTEPNNYTLSFGDTGRPACRLDIIAQRHASLRVEYHFGPAYVGHVLESSDVDALIAWLQRWREANPPPSAAEAMAELRERFGHYFDAIEDVDEWVRQQRSGEDVPPTRP